MLTELLHATTRDELAARIDQTILTLDNKEFSTELRESVKHPFRCILTWPMNIQKVKEVWRNRVCTVANFPSGMLPLQALEKELSNSWDLGADEVDVAISPVLIKLDPTKYREYVKYVVSISRDIGFSTVKIIVETPLLSIEELKVVTHAVEASGADYLKTSTGIFSKSSLKDVYVVKSISPHVNVKASGGIKGALETLAYIDLGASIIGSSSGIKILEEFDQLKRIGSLK
ncbi:hypothetical protein EYM_03415 [Ignicoccus islandicus DSM 13165]|uniref:Uncharacterized protein n=1 Tax=Ignicoccus islandicus DSM 13165 TaxID=940295 RepID=A0A0U3FKP5_9CREN|nr:hypothetical protein [Ignicoccus islandicus]ALU12406.1 hypothetical protein EYM_03415 [Ignicoccus islandicus DSM 13165]